MSGLFTRLARKARGDDIGAARLLVPTPFEEAGAMLGEPEPPAAASGAASAAVLAAARRRTSPMSVPEPVGAPQPATAASPAGPASPNSSAEQLVTRGSGLAGTASAPTTASPSDPGAPAPRGPAAAPASPRDTIAPPVDGAAPDDRARTGGRLLAPTRAAAPAVRPVSGQRTLGPATAPPSGPAPLGHVDDAVLAAEDAEPVTDDGPLLGPVPRSRPPARAPRTEPRDLRTEAGGQAETEPRPVVRVTIGRVDVRGATPATPAPRPPPARHQPQSLDEYLRRRDRHDGDVR